MIVVTGAGGYVGRRVVARLEGAGVAAHNVEHRWHGRAELEQLLEGVDVDSCIHLGWYANPADYLWAAGPNLECLASSVDLVDVLLERGCGHLVVAGSSAEYGSPDGVVDELSPADPRTVYAASKTALRVLLESSWVRGRMDVAWARIFNVVGPGESPERVVPLVTRSLLRGEAVSLSDGLQERDFLHVDDVAAALVSLGDARASGVFNVSSGKGVPLRDVFTGLADRAGAPRDLLRFGERPRRADDPDRLVGANDRLRAATRWRPSMTFEVMLDDVVYWWTAEASVPRTSEVVSR